MELWAKYDSRSDDSDEERDLRMMGAASEGEFSYVLSERAWRIQKRSSGRDSIAYSPRYIRLELWCMDARGCHRSAPYSKGKAVGEIGADGFWYMNPDQALLAS